MVKCGLVFLLVFANFITILAQKVLTGVYELNGIHEMASAFKFNADKSFEFFYSYGATDRSAIGSYEIIGDTIRLKSQKIAGQDFEIANQKVQGSGYHLVFKHPNKYLVNKIRCVVFTGLAKKEYYSGQDGEVDISESKVDKIFAQHELFPDIMSLIKDETNNNNYFELNLKPSLGEVSFKGIDLFIKGNELRMLPNLFMPFENIVYRKQE